MQCEICRKKVKTKKNIINLFHPEIHHICENCYLENPLIPRLEILPIQEGIIYHHSMLVSRNKLSGLAYMSMMKPYYIDFMKSHTNNLFIYQDQLDEKLYHQMDSLKLGDIYLLTLYENIEKGEKL
ncbi:MAG: hypothetical protein JXC31_01725 [Acholeplasmataceae bacterium]|nr:hypothetical protein [Acholeplasmataceae bacterium]